jgi:hypothetical protein
MNARHLLAGTAIASVVAVLAAAFSLTGSPSHQRQLALDRRRVALLQQTAYAIAQRYDEASLPDALPDAIVQNDPESGRPFEYRRMSGTRYQLCATFALAGEDDPAYAYGEDASRWNHGPGKRCFTERIAPAR